MPNRSNETLHPDTEAVIVDRRINTYWERAALGLMAIVMSLIVWTYQQQSAKVEALETKVIALDKVKVDKGDLREVEDRLNSKMDGLRTDIINRQDIMQSNILGRLDLYFQTKK